MHILSSSNLYLRCAYTFTNFKMFTTTLSLSLPLSLSLCHFYIREFFSWKVYSKGYLPPWHMHTNQMLCKIISVCFLISVCTLFIKFLLSNSTLPLMNSVQILNELSGRKTIHFFFMCKFSGFSCISLIVLQVICINYFF